MPLKNICISMLGMFSLITLELNAQDDLSAELEVIRSNYNLPGLMAVALKDGKIVATGAAGVRRLGSPGKLQLSDSINVGSNTKWMTATIAGRLVDEGVISWDTQIKDVFENFSEFTEVFQSATIATILSHRSGIMDGAQFEAKYWNAVQARTGSIVEIREWVVDTVLSEPNQVPSGEYLYANQGYTTAARFMEIATGKSWEDLMIEHIYKPARMVSGTTGSAYANSNDLGTPVGHWMVSSVLGATPSNPLPSGAMSKYQASTGPGGLAVCTLLDWAKWLNLQVTADINDYLTADTATRLQTGYGNVDGYGLGVSAVSRSWATPGPALSHTGIVNLQSSVFWIAPGRDLVTVIYSNCRSQDSTVLNAMDQVAGMLINNYASVEAVGPYVEVPVAGSVGFSDNKLSIEYESLPGVSYRLESSGDLINWSEVSGVADQEATNSSSSVSTPPTSETEFFRLRALP